MCAGSKVSIYELEPARLLLKVAYIYIVLCDRGHSKMIEFRIWEFSGHNYVSSRTTCSLLSRSQTLRRVRNGLQ